MQLRSSWLQKKNLRMWSSHKQRNREWRNPNHAGPSTIDGRKCSREADRLLLDARENVGAPTSQRRQRRSPNQYTGYMALMIESVETDPSSFEEVV